MLTVRRTDEFIRWLKDLRDIRARAKIVQRIDRLALGNPGDAAPVGKGVSELRIHYGAGYRVYFVQRGEELVLLRRRQELAGFGYCIRQKTGE
jgi:putative addiction module killer protein